MNNFIETFEQIPIHNVHIVYVRPSSRIFYSLEEISAIKELAWVDRGKIMAELLQAAHGTDPDNFSLIALYEENKTIKTMMNIGHDFGLDDL